MKLPVIMLRLISLFISMRGTTAGRSVQQTCALKNNNNIRKGLIMITSGMGLYNLGMSRHGWVGWGVDYHTSNISYTGPDGTIQTV